MKSNDCCCSNEGIVWFVVESEDERQEELTRILAAGGTLLEDGCRTDRRGLIYICCKIDRELGMSQLGLTPESFEDFEG